jgi:hypothetical protein
MTFSLVGTLTGDVESRGEPSTPANAEKPIEYRTKRAELEVTRTLAFGQLKLNSTLESVDFETATLDDGSLLSEDFRDRDMWKVELQGGVLVGGSTTVFLRGAYQDFNYTDTVSAGDIDRDSTTKAAFTGAAFDITNLMRGELGVGVMEVDHAAATQGKQRSLALRSNVEIFLTQLVTLNLSAQRATGGSDIVGSSSYIGTTLGGSLDYELRRNFIVSAKFARTKRDYSGIDASLSSHTAGLAAQWLMNRNLRFSIDYSYVDRAESEIGRRYSANRILAGLRLVL